VDIAVIGGSGFIGTSFVTQLASAGERFSIIDKNPSEAHPDARVAGDVRSLDDMRLRLKARRFDAVVNLAAEHKDDVRPEALYHDVNVTGAQNVCDAATEAGIDTIIFTSSVAVYGFAAPDTDERGELNPFNEYGRTKALAEDVYVEWQSTEPTKRSLVIVRPTVVFGIGNRGNVYNLLRQIAGHRFVMVGNGKNRKSMAYVENVAAFLVHTLQLGPGAHMYNYIDKPDLTMNELVALAGRILGRPSKRRPHMPYLLGYAGGLVLDAVGRVTRTHFPVSAIRVKKFCSNTQFASSRIQDSGFAAPYELSAALERTIRHEFVDGGSE
jgi:GlcNAc-P-P-Und epimerase